MIRTAEMTESSKQSDQVMVVTSVSYRYPRSDADVVKDFSHCFRAGTVTALVAPSGAGKSTLLSILGLLLQPRIGNITIDGVLADWRKRSRLIELRTDRYGWILQSNACFEARTALDNVAIALLASGARMAAARSAARDALDAVGLAHRADMPARMLSGGEQQRMTIARALLGDRPVLLADEPTGNLDRANSQMVVSALRACADSGTTVIVATHDLEAASMADGVIDLARNAYSANITDGLVGAP